MAKCCSSIPLVGLQFSVSSLYCGLIFLAIDSRPSTIYNVFFLCTSVSAESDLLWAWFTVRFFLVLPLALSMRTGACRSCLVLSLAMVMELTRRPPSKHACNIAHPQGHKAPSLSQRLMLDLFHRYHQCTLLS